MGWGVQIARNICINKLEKDGLKFNNQPSNIELAKALGYSTNNKKLAQTRVLEYAAAIINKDVGKLEAARKAARMPKKKKQKAFNSDTVSEKAIKAFYDSWEWARLALDCKLRDGRRCMCCGATPADGVRIVSDHIKPIRKYWELRLDANNIQTLCDVCNKGKGSRLETDFRK